MMVKSGLVFYFEILLSLSEFLLPSAKKLPGKAELAWQITLKGLVEFRNKKLDHFSPSYLTKTNSPKNQVHQNEVHVQEEKMHDF